MFVLCWKMAVAWRPTSEKTKVGRKADATFCSVLVGRQMCRNAFDCIWVLIGWIHQNNLVDMGILGYGVLSATAGQICCSLGYASGIICLLMQGTLM
jgi:hypothetical protein